MDLMTYLLCKQSGGGSLPEVTPADNGKILGVVQGVWNAANPDDLIDIPIIQEVGTIENPIDINDLPDGLYGVKGPHSIGTTDFSTDSNVIVLKQTVNGKEQIKRITAESEVIYTFDEYTGQLLTVSEAITDTYLFNNHYITQEALEARLFNFEQEIELYVTNQIAAAMDNIQSIAIADIEALFE